MSSDNDRQDQLEVQEARRQRKAKEKQAKSRAVLVLAVIIVIMALLVVLVLVQLLRARMNSDLYSSEEYTAGSMSIEYVGEKTEPAEREQVVEEEEEPEPKEVPVLATDMVVSTHVYMIRPEDDEVVLDQGAEEQIYPASMTKIMTALLAVENLDLSAQHIMMYDEIAAAINQDATMAGFSEGEVITIEDLLYGALLPSGADACYALASEVIEKQTGSVQTDYEAQFVELMNAKAAEIGMENTNFSNCTGLQAYDHYTTCKDMAVLLEYALQNDTFRQIISSHTYTTSSTDYHEDGILLTSTLFGSIGSSILDNGTIILGGKTGYTDEAGHCLASYADTKGETRYILVTAGAYTDVNDYSHISDAKYLYGQLPEE